MTRSVSKNLHSILPAAREFLKPLSQSGELLLGNFVPLQDIDMAVRERCFVRWQPVSGKRTIGRFPVCAIPVLICKLDADHALKFSPVAP